MKQIYSVLYAMYDLLLLVILGILLVSLVIIVITNSWFHLFLCFTILLYLYKSQVVKFGKK